MLAGNLVGFQPAPPEVLPPDSVAIGYHDLLVDQVVRDLVVGRDGRYLISPIAPDAIKILELPNGRESRTLQNSEKVPKGISISFVRGIRTAAVTPDGQYVISGGQNIQGNPNGVIKVWDLRTGRIVRVLRAHRGQVTSIKLTPDGKYVVSGSDSPRASKFGSSRVGA